MDIQKSQVKTSETTANENDTNATEGLPKHAQTVEAIQTWLVSQLIEQMGIEPHEIDVRAPFDSYGLDSVVMVSLAGDLEDWLGRRFSPNLLYEYSTIETLAQYLAEEANVVR